MTATNSSNYVASEETSENVLPTPKEETQGSGTEGKDAPSFEELSVVFDAQFDMLTKKNGLLDSLSKNSLVRVIKKILAYPLRDDEIPLQRKDETLPFEIGVNVQQVKMQMVIADIVKQHKEEAEKLKKKHEETKGVESE